MAERNSGGAVFVARGGNVYLFPEARVGISRFLKRAADVAFSSLLLLFLLLPMFCLAVLIRCETRGPAIFRQTRLGKGLVPFTIYKFRTMTVDAPKNRPSAELCGEERDKVLTRVGKLLRRTSLDELPQLWNVFRGEMSLIGPRPVIPEERELHALRAALGATGVRPGITGLAQTVGRDDNDAETKAYFDAFYARNFSPKLDFRILCRTVRTVVSGIGNN